MGETFFDFCLPLHAELMTTVRLTVGGLAAAAGLDVDAGEDFKVCVTEALLVFKRNGFHKVNAHFDVKEGLKAVLTVDISTKENKNGDIEDEISYALLGALVDETAFEKNGETITGITLKKSV